MIPINFALVNCQQAQFTHDHNIHGSIYIYIYRERERGMYECKRMPMIDKVGASRNRDQWLCYEYKKL